VNEQQCQSGGMSFSNRVNNIMISNTQIDPISSKYEQSKF
jgi:hypothetical protein